jgi:hypothetical protein
VHGALSAVPSNRYLGEYTPVLHPIMVMSPVMRSAQGSIIFVPTKN